jgi:hypothetical protein
MNLRILRVSRVLCLSPYLEADHNNRASTGVVPIYRPGL